MNPNTNNLQELLQQLSSEDSTIVSEAAISLRPFLDCYLVSQVINILHKITNQRNIFEITGLLSNFQKKEIIPVLIDSIRNDSYQNIRSQLVSVCWQSNLNYSVYLPLFVDLIINDEMNVAIEACTVIENFPEKVNAPLLLNEISRLKQHFGKFDVHKQKLVEELLLNIDI